LTVPLSHPRLRHQQRFTAKPFGKEALQVPYLGQVVDDNVRLRGVTGHVVLVVAFSGVEGLAGFDFGDDGGIENAGGVQLGDVGAGELGLFVRLREDGRAVLRAAVGALAVQLGGVVGDGKEDAQDFARADIESLLPGREGHVGVTAWDNRLFVEAVLYRYRAGIPWRDLPERFGDFRMVHTRFGRRARAGVWERLLKALSEDADNGYAMMTRPLCERINTVELPWKF